MRTHPSDLMKVTRENAFAMPLSTHVSTNGNLAAWEELILTSLLLRCQFTCARRHQANVWVEQTAERTRGNGNTKRLRGPKAESTNKTTGNPDQ